MSALLDSRNSIWSMSIEQLLGMSIEQLLGKACVIGVRG